MHTDHVAHKHSVWADLEALVLEEVDALGRPREIAEPARFGSEDEFLAEAAHYLRQRQNPEQLIDQLREELGIHPQEDGPDVEAEIDDNLDEVPSEPVPPSVSPESEPAVVPPAPDPAAQ